MNKKCLKCNNEMDLSNFSWKNKANGILSKYCKACTSIQNKQYRKNPKYLESERERRLKNKEKIMLQKKEWNKNNKDKIYIYNKKRRKNTIPSPYKNRRDRELDRKYSISEDDFNSIMDKQNSKCAICGIEHKEYNAATSRTFAVDHCHSTLLVRGLLCHKCNLAIGLFNDDIEIIKNAIIYLKK